jgi:hypothetical protein
MGIIQTFGDHSVDSEHPHYSILQKLECHKLNEMNYLENNSKPKKLAPRILVVLGCLLNMAKAPVVTQKLDITSHNKVI